MRLEPTNNQIAVLAIVLVVSSLVTQWVYLDIARDQISGRAVNTQQAGVRMCINRPPVIIENCPDTAMQGEPYYCDINLFDKECDESCLVTNTTLLHVSGDTLTSFWFENRCSRNVTLSEVSLSWSGSDIGIEEILLDGSVIGSYGGAPAGIFDVADRELSGVHELEFVFNGSVETSRIEAGLSIGNSTKELTLVFDAGAPELIREEQLCEHPYFFTATASPPMGPYFSVDPSTGFVNMTLPITYDDTFTGHNPYSVQLYGDDGMMCSTSGVSDLMSLTVQIDNHPPHITTALPTTNISIHETENVSFFMQFEDYDNEGNGSGDNHSVRWLVDDEVVRHVNVSYAAPHDRYRYIANYTSAGNHTIDVEVSDEYYTRTHRWHIEVQNMNRPPRFTAILPNQTWDQNQIRAAFSLDDFVEDPDGDDTLSYTPVSSVPFPAISVTIDVSNANLVLFAPPRNWHGHETVAFNVTDGHGGSDLSNVVHLRVREVDTPQASADDGGGGGSSGGGGARQRQRGEHEWFCGPWSVCDENGTRTRICYDLAECGTDEGKPPEKQNCTYIPHCYNGRQDQVEDGIDCGGPCPPCDTCFDREQNLGEEGVDCGGPCPPCPTCSDGEQNQGEEGTDCGGPCPPCMNCSDGIQNFGEKGVDCGGPCDRSCVRDEEPSLVVKGETDEPLFSISTMLVILSIIGVLGVAVMFGPVIHGTMAPRRKRQPSQKKAVTYDVDSLMHSEGEPREKVERISHMVRQALVDHFHLTTGLTFEEMQEQLSSSDDEAAAKAQYVLRHLSELLYKRDSVDARDADMIAGEVWSLMRELGVLTHVSQGAVTDSQRVERLIHQSWDALSSGKEDQAKAYYEEAKKLYENAAMKEKLYPELHRLFKELKGQ